ncbi:MAG: homoserine dehydrogenase [Lachnospiraceae bacterium]|nr:homoserine dehydrogenase [Lachnospiraceae bacterium]
MIKVAVFGYGTVGSGVVEVIEKNKAQVAKKAGEELEVKYILDLREFPGDPYESKVVHDASVIMNDPEVKIVCETMGGTTFAYNYTKAALENGKSVCTSNKEMVAKYGPELIKLAHDHGCNYLFEASVGGGIPIIRPLNDCLTAEKVEAITGILNGTTNYILTKMEREGKSFDEALARAQEKGYAERNPEADVEGFDACRKIAILSSLMMGKNVNYEKIPTEGISKITPADFEYANAAGRTIKLLARAKMLDDNTVEAMVSPVMLDKESPLAMVSFVFNAILVKGNMLGEAMFYGKGAGKLATASAVVGDVIDCARHMGKEIPCFWDAEDAVVADAGKHVYAYYLRAKKNAKEALQALLPGGEFIELADRAQDLAYFTQPMAQNAFEKVCEGLGDLVLGSLRLG